MLRRPHRISGPELIGQDARHERAVLHQQDAATRLSRDVADSVTSTTSTALGAAFVDVGVARPIWLGDLALAPSIGLRVMSARRNVRVNERERLSVAIAVPELGSR